MSESGFFFPFVTPEWCERNGACYALILNNDNGVSKDNGDTIVYAGSGGRYRGQNRTATQSFDQTWKNVTNASLKRNFEEKRPVRVIRGPKLDSPHGTRSSGGGFRYDGLYNVIHADLVPTKWGKRMLKTAMFTLKRKTAAIKKKSTSASKIAGQVAWHWGRTICYGTLIPSKENSKYCYARTHKGNIKTLAKGKAYWWVLEDEGKKKNKKKKAR